jgi:nitrogen fixation protein FixH
MRHSAWRFFPWAVIGGLGIVVLVNAGMVFAALHSFPGQAGSEDFALSNHYDAVLDREARDAALGWTVTAVADDSGRPLVMLTQRDSTPLRGASVAASAERPIGAPQPRTLGFRETTPGHYLADAALPVFGQWELTLSASVGGSAMTITRRVVVH